MEKIIHSPPSQLENSFNAKIERHFNHTEPDVLAQFLLDKRNPSTRKAYEKDLNDFFRATTCNGLQKLNPRLAKTAVFGSDYFAKTIRFGSQYLQMDSHYLQTAHKN